jgi:hypothetical protein
MLDGGCCNRVSIRRSAPGQLMISGFTLMVWAPRVAAAPESRALWTALLVSSAPAGACWAVAHSIREV